MKTKKILAVLLAAVMLLGFLAGCGSSSSGSEAAGKTHLNVVSDMFSQPDAHDLSPSWFVMRIGVSECLVKFGDDSSYQPWLAKSWELADDNLTWTFHLQEGVKFSNGADMTATKVMESVEYLYEQQEARGMVDAASFMTYTEISADDAANTVTIKTAEPVPDMPGVMAYPLFAIIDAEATRGRNMLLEGPIGTGPYVITSYTDGHDYQLARNENYWDGEVPFATVSFVKVAEANARYTALLDGSADVATHIQASDLPALEAAGYTISNVSGARDGYFHVNFEGPLGNDTLRRAVFMAIDDETVCDITTGGSYTAGYTPLAPVFTNWGGDKIDDPTAYDPEGAMALLDAAGIVDSDNDGWREFDGSGENIELTYITVTSRQMGDIAQAHAALIQAIGIQCNVQIVDSQGDYMDNGTFDMVNSNEIIIATGDPTNFLGHWYSGNGVGYNYARYQNDEYDSIYEKLKVEMDTDQRNAYIAQLNELLTNECVIMMGGYYNFNICSSTAVTGAYNPPCDFYWITKDIKPAA